MLLAVATYTLLFVPDAVSKLKGQFVAAIFYVTNWYLIVQKISYFEQFGRPSPLTHLWSLAVEEQFYLVWPIVFLLLLKHFRDRVNQLALTILGGALASSLLMAVLYNAGSDPSRVYFGTDTRASGLLVGAALAVVWRPWESRRRPHANRGLLADLGGYTALGFVLFFCVVCSETGPFLYRGGFLVVSLMSGLLIACCVSISNRLLHQGLGARPFVWVGQRSYGIYLWHWPIFVMTRPGVDVPFRGVTDLGFRLLLTGVAASLSYRYVEMPIRHGALGRWWAVYKASEGDRRRDLGRQAGALACVMAVFVGGVGVAVARHAPVESELQRTLDAAGKDPSSQAGSQHGPTTTASTPVATTTLAAATSIPGARSPTSAAAPTTLVPFAAHAPFAVGDSVMLGAYKALQQAIPGIRVDAKVGRQWSAGQQLLSVLKANGQLGDTVIIHLGNNGVLNSTEFASMMKVLASVPHVVILDIRVDQAYQDNVNTLLRTNAAKYPNVRLLDWYAYSTGHGGWFYDDGTHLRPTGAAAYASYIAGNI
jgi:peptidoglycan/LPS O-acetylase OafA/YrhL